MPWWQALRSCIFDFLAHCLQMFHSVFLKFYFTFYLFILSRAFSLSHITVCRILQIWIKILYCFVGVYYCSTFGTAPTFLFDEVVALNRFQTEISEPSCSCLLVVSKDEIIKPHPSLLGVLLSIRFEKKR